MSIQVVPFKLVGNGLTADDFEKVPLAELLPTAEKRQKFIEAAYAVSKMPQFANCLVESLVGAIVKAATLGLSLSQELGQCYLLPINEADRTKPKNQSGYFPKLPYDTVQFIIGYRGWKEMAFEAGVIESINPGVCMEGDDFTIVKGSKDVRGVRHIPKYQTETVKVAYCVIDFKGGGDAIYDLSIADLERLRKKNKSQQYNNCARSGPWLTDHPMMCLAKVIKGGIDKLTPASGSRLSQALIYDETLTNRTVEGEIIEEKTETHETPEAKPANAVEAAREKTNAEKAAEFLGDFDPSKATATTLSAFLAKKVTNAALSDWLFSKLDPEDQIELGYLFKSHAERGYKPTTAQ